MQPAKRILHEPDPNKFDLRTHIWDGQGMLVKKNLYTNHVVNGTAHFERPINSGNLWFENNQPAGRVEYILGADGKTTKRIDLEASHIDYIAPLEGAEKMHYELENERRKSADLEKELAAIKAERAPAAGALEAKLAPAPAMTNELSLKKKG